MSDDAEKVWRSFPGRQLTGAPHLFHGYVGRGNRCGQTCCTEDHHSLEEANRCAFRRAAELNREEDTVSEKPIVPPRVSIGLDAQHWGLLDLVAERQGLTRSTLAARMVTEALDAIVSEVGGFSQQAMLHPLLDSPKETP